MTTDKKEQLKLTLLSTVFFAALAVLFGLGLGSVGLFDVLEARTAQMSIEMLKSGPLGYVLFNGQNVMGEFPLMHILQMGAFHYFEPSAFSARLPVAVLGFLFVFVLYNSMYILTADKRFALIAASVAALNVAMVVLAKIAVPDSLFWFLTLCSTLMTMGSVFDLNKNYIRVMIAGFLAGGAFLAGGYGGIILPLGVGLVLAFVRHQPAHNLQQLSPITFLLAAFLAIFPWAIGFVKAHSPDAFLTYFEAMLVNSWHTTIDPSLLHPKQLVYCVLAFFPWSLFVIPALTRHLRHGTRYLTSNLIRQALPAVAMVWFVFGMVGLVFVEVQLSTIFYLMLIPTAILVADLFDKMPEKPLQSWHVLYIAPLCLVIAAGVMLAPQWLEAARGDGALAELIPHLSHIMPWHLPLGSETTGYAMLGQSVEWGMYPVLVGALVLVGTMVGVFIMRHGGREAALFVGGGALMALMIGSWAAMPRAYEYKQQPLHWISKKIIKDQNPKTDHTIVYGVAAPSVRFEVPGVVSYIQNPSLVVRAPGRRLFVITDKSHLESLEGHLPASAKPECLGGYCLIELFRMK